MSASEWDTDIAQLLIVGDFPTGGFIEIGSDVPPELVAFYATNYNGTIARAWIKFQPGANFYSYILSMQTAPLGSDAALAYGHVYNNVAVREETISFIVPGAVAPTPQIQRHHGRFTQMYEVWGNPFAGPADPLTQLFFQNVQILIQTTFNGRQAGADISIDGVSMGRGQVTQATSTVNSAAVGALTAVLTTPSVNFQNGRAFKFETGGPLLANTAGADVSAQVRENVVGGTLLIDFGRLYNNPVAGNPYNEQPYGVFVNTTGGDITAAIAYCLSAGAGTVVQSGSASRPRWINVTDIGEASRYPMGLSL